jgi:hypothetical protein
MWNETSEQVAERADGAVQRNGYSKGACEGTEPVTLVGGNRKGEGRPGTLKPASKGPSPCNLNLNP